MLSGYGRELFSTFVPSSARARLDESVVPTAGLGVVSARSATALLSGALVARHGRALQGPVIEVTYTACASLTGVLRAARHRDLIVAVSVPAAARAAAPHAPRALVDDVLAAVGEAHFDRPLVIVARAQPLPPGASIDRLSEGLHRDLDAGFTSMAFSSAALRGDVDALARVTAPLVEQDLGLEVELDGAGDAALVLARIDDAGLSLSAARGARSDDELGDALLVVDAGTEVAGTPARVCIDAAVAAGCKRVPAGDDERLEAAAFLAAAEALEALGASGTSTALLDALAQGMSR